MQRAAYGQSPPLHHPVPQHVSTVPQLRSPPPPTSQPQGYDGSPYTQQQQHQQPGPQGQAPGGNFFGQYGNFVNDPAAQIAQQFGQQAFRQGTALLEQNVNRFVNVSALKHYFNVTNSYVVNKLFLVLFPWRHKPWTRRQGGGAAPGVAGGSPEAWYFLPPRDDINSPDMYIPVMSVVTYIFVRTLIAGLQGKFQPELFGSIAATALVVVILEIMGLKLGCYLLNISERSQLLDLVAYSGYKFVGVIVTIAISEIVNGGKGTGGWVGWSLFVYTFLANSLFLMRSLKYVLLPENNEQNRGPMQTMHPIDSRAKRSQRTQFLFGYSYIVQAFLMWILCRA
ncbi:putative transport protein [Podospora australis]|uniref:Protein YIF1 n=1 Tax=Podospora australis TaxID=1536484 RepID=A0AAN6X1W1_9PEZI|nr:putative transport protein [Podospora australis]